MEELIKDAQQYILQEPQSKKDVFMALCSLNLLNAAIKKKEYKKSLSYGFIKPHVSKLLIFCISHINEGYVDELYYASQEHCVYIRCYGIQLRVTQKPRDFEVILFLLYRSHRLYCRMRESFLGGGSNTNNYGYPAEDKRDNRCFYGKRLLYL